MENRQKSLYKKPIGAFSGKIMMFCMVLLMSISIISALDLFDYDNYKSFEKDVGNYGKATIYDKAFLGFGKDTILQEVELKTNTEICSNDNCKAEKEIILHEKGVLIEDLRFIDMNGGGKTSIKDYNIYVDGKEYELGTEVDAGTYQISTEGELYAFQEVDWQIKVKGFWIEEWAVWTSSLNTNLVTYWNFDEGTGINAEDVTGNGNNLVGLNTPGWSASGILGSATDLDKVSSEAWNYTSDVMRNNVLIKNDSTVNGWINYPSFLGRAYFISGSGSASAFYRMSVESETNLEISNLGRSNTTSNLGFNRWIMVTLVSNLTDTRLYINGTLTTISVGTQASPGALTDFIIGKQTGVSTNYFEGLIDEVGMWDRTLNDSEILTLYNSGSAIAFPIGVELSTPLNDTSSIDVPMFFNATINPTAGLTLNNATISVWTKAGVITNRTTQRISGTSQLVVGFNISNLGLNTYIWNVEQCSNDSSTTSCSFSKNNFTLDYGLQINSQTFNNLTFGGSQESFELNLTLIPGVVISDAVMNYNGTNFTSTIVSVGNNVELTNTITIPTVGQQTNFTFNFLMTLDGELFQTSQEMQQVVSINMTNCTAGGTLILNMSLFDEKLKTKLLGDIQVNAQTRDKTSLEVAGSANLTFTNITSGGICISPIEALTNVFLDTEIRYSSVGYASELYHIQRADLTEYPINLSLFDLSNNESTEFLLTYQDDDLVFVEGAIIQLQRKYISEDLFEVVEAPLTSDGGTAVVHIDLDTNKYQVTIVKNGVVLDIFENLVFNCENELSGQCSQRLLGQIDPQNDISVEDLTDFSVAITQDNDTINTLFSIPSGVPASVNILLIQRDQFNNTYPCNNTVFSSAGSVSCVLTPTIGDSYIDLTIKKSGELKSQKSYLVPENLGLDFFGNNYFILIILMLSLVGMAFTSPEWIILNAVITMVLAGGLYLANGVNFVIGLGNLIWLVIGAVILILKISHQEDR